MHLNSKIVKIWMNSEKFVLPAVENGILCARHYNPRLVYFYTIFWRPSLCFKDVFTIKSRIWKTFKLQIFSPFGWTGTWVDTSPKKPNKMIAFMLNKCFRLSEWGGLTLALCFYSLHWQNCMTIILNHTVTLPLDAKTITSPLKYFLVLPSVD